MGSIIFIRTTKPHRSIPFHNSNRRFPLAKPDLHPPPLTISTIFGLYLARTRAGQGACPPRTAARLACAVCQGTRGNDARLERRQGVPGRGVRRRVDVALTTALCDARRRTQGAASASCARAQGAPELRASPPARRRLARVGELLRGPREKTYVWLDVSVDRERVVPLTRPRCLCEVGSRHARTCGIAFATSTRD
ncbi:hypothetical protein NFJ02_27g63230 [Pycnococcus provasolii]